VLVERLQRARGVPVTSDLRQYEAALAEITRLEPPVRAPLRAVRVVDGALSLSAVRLERPSSTWTYLVDADSFRDRIGSLLTGPGGATVAIYAAVVLWPLLLVWGLVERFLRRRAR
jgi:hypothetical protein